MATATESSLGEIQLTTDLAGDGGAQIGTSPQLTHLSVTPGSYTLADITIDVKGRVTAIADGTPGDVAALVPDATTTTSGLVSIGDNLYITTAPTAGFQDVDFGGNISVGSDPTGLANESCSTYSFDVTVDNGDVQTVTDTGNNLQTYQDVLDAINAQTTGLVASFSAGNIRLLSDTTGKFSTILISNDSIFSCMTDYVSILAADDGNGSCEIHVKDATGAIAGVVRIGTGIDVTAGVISVDCGSLPIATPTTIGGVIVPTAGYIDVDGAGEISIPQCSESVFGVMKAGTGLDVTAGVVSVDETELALATTSTVGVVKVGSNINVDGAGELSVDTATASILGVVKVGAGLLVTAGVISVDTSSYPDATTTSKGVMQIGDHLNDTGGAGIVGVDKASGATTYGVVRSADTNNLTITTGQIDVGTNIPKKDAANSYSKAQTVALDTLTSATTINTDASLGNVFDVTLAHNATLANPTNLSAGQTLIFTISQDATGGRTLAFGTAFKFRQGVTPVVSSTANKQDLMTCVSDGTNLFCSYNRDFS